MLNKNGFKYTEKETPNLLRIASVLIFITLIMFLFVGMPMEILGIVAGLNLLFFLLSFLNR